MTQDELKQILHYDPLTGDFTWLQNYHKRRIGTVAGGLDHYGYRVIQIGPKKYKSHRLAWLYMYGVLPTVELDHKDNNKQNNAILNLREVTTQKNLFNKTTYKNNKSGYVGVVFNKKCNKWQSQIRVNGRALHLGLFNTPEEAHDAYLKAKVIHHII